MKKNYIFGIAAALMMGTVALSSCSSEELTVKNEVQQAEVAKTYSFSVPASMDDEAGTRVFELGESTITSAFSTAEPVYVIIEKKNGSNIAYGCDKDDNTKMALYPTDVSADGASCTIITDNLTFIPKAPGFEVEVGDKVYLCYGMTVELDSNPFEGYFDFTTDGKKATAESMDYNLVVTTIKSVDNGVLTFNDNFSFKNINSIFRQRLTFKEGSNVVTPNISQLTISTANNKIVTDYYPLDGLFYYGACSLNPEFSESTDFYFSTIFNDVNKNEAITFTATDTDGNVYSCTKSAPTGGFQNNMYYYGEAILGKEGIPTITGADGLEADPIGIFYLGGLENPITISGSSEGFAFELYDDMGEQSYEGPITLNNVNATFRGDSPFIYDANEPNVSVLSLELILTGDNTLTCRPNIAYCISVGELKLSCTGESATLTLIANKLNDGSGQYYYGIFTKDYYYEDGNLYNNDLTVLAATGYTVTREGPTDINEEYYSTKYTVTKNP